jgi:MFS family permease
LSDLEPSTEVANPGIDARRRVALAVVLSGIFVTVMDSSIVNVAIPVIRSTLHASFGEAELTVATYALAFSAGMITGDDLATSTASVVFSWWPLQRSR